MVLTTGSYSDVLFDKGREMGLALWQQHNERRSRQRRVIRLSSWSSGGFLTLFLGQSTIWRGVSVIMTWSST